MTSGEPATPDATPGRPDARPAPADAVTHHSLDLFATLLDVAGRPLPEPRHGRPLLPILKGEGTPPGWPGDACCEFHGGHMGLYSMRPLTTDAWAYVYHTNDIDELYDRKNDPWQLRNLAESPDHAPVLAALRRRMVEWMAPTDDHLHNEWTVDWLTGDPALAAQAPGRRRTKW